MAKPMVKRMAQMGCSPINMKDLYILSVHKFQHALVLFQPKVKKAYSLALPNVSNGRNGEGHGEEDRRGLVGGINPKTARYFWQLASLTLST
jgi:hypothetical protein